MGTLDPLRDSSPIDVRPVGAEPDQSIQAGVYAGQVTA